MKLLTSKLERRFAQVGSQDGKGGEALVIAKFFTCFSSWTWYATEYDPATRCFFGWVEGVEPELGYFSLDEFEDLNRQPGLHKIERDLYWTEKPLKDIASYAERML